MLGSILSDVHSLTNISVQFDKVVLDRDVSQHAPFVLTPVANACMPNGQELNVIVTTLNLLKISSMLCDKTVAADGTYKVEARTLSLNMHYLSPTCVVFLQPCKVIIYGIVIIHSSLVRCVRQTIL